MSLQQFDHSEALQKMAKAWWDDAIRTPSLIKPDGTWNFSAFGSPEPFTPTFRWRVKNSDIAYWWSREVERIRLLWKVVWGLSTGKLDPYDVEVMG